MYTYRDCCACRVNAKAVRHFFHALLFEAISAYGDWNEECGMNEERRMKHET